jgi:hypothetical protein
MSAQADGGNLSPYSSSQEAFDQYMKAIRMLTDQINRESHTETDPEKINEALEAERRNIKEPVWAMSIDPRHHGYNQ